MKKWLRLRKIKKLRNQLLSVREEQMHYRFMAQHCNEAIHDIKEQLDDLGAFHSDNLIALDLKNPQFNEPKAIEESKVITTDSTIL